MLTYVTLHTHLQVILLLYTRRRSTVPLSPLFHILQVTKGKTADGSSRTAQSSKGKNPVSKILGKLKSPDSSPRSSRSFQKLLANSPRSDSSRIKSNDTTTTKSLIVPKIGPPLEPRSKRKLRLAPESNPYKSFKLPFATQSHMATKDRGPWTVALYLSVSSPRLSKDCSQWQCSHRGWFVGSYRLGTNQDS